MAFPSLALLSDPETCFSYPMYREPDGVASSRSSCSEYTHGWCGVAACCGCGARRQYTASPQDSDRHSNGCPSLTSELVVLIRDAMPWPDRRATP